MSDNLTGLVAPSATPAPALRRLHDAVVIALKKPEVVRQLTHQGVIPTPAAADELRRLMREERARWAPIITANGIRADG